MDKERHTPPNGIVANWKAYERRPTWSVVSSRELAQVLGVSLQTICNWRLRGKLPAPVKHPRLRGNKVYYRISSIRSWLEDTSEEIIHWEWIRRFMDTGTPFASIEQAKDVARVCWKTFEIEKPRVDF